MHTRVYKCELMRVAMTFVALAGPAAAQFVTQVGTDARGVSWTDRTYLVGRNALSSNGRWLVFSDAGAAYRRDLWTGEVTLASPNWLTGAPAGGENASISDDGNLVCFETWEGSNVPGDSNFAYDVFVRDMALGITTRVSVDPFGSQLWGSSTRPTISRDGSTVVFESDDSNVVFGDSNNWRDVFVHDVETGVNELISVDPAGQPGQASPHLCGSHPLIPCYWGGGSSTSSDGRYVAFGSLAHNLVPGGTAPGRVNVFVRDRRTGITELTSVNDAGQPGDSHSWYPAMSGDGRYVAFESWSTNFAPSGWVEPHAFVHDRWAGTTHWVDRNSNGTVANGVDRFISISGDGMWVGYASDASDLVPGDTNGTSDAFVTHWQSGLSRLLSQSTSGQTGFAYGGDPVALSWDGSRSAFQSGSNALVAGPPDDKSDVFLRDENVQSVPVVAYCTAKTNSLGCQPAMSTSGICSFTFGTPFFVTSQFERSHQPAMMVWSTAPAALPFSGGFVCVQLPMQRTPLQSTGGTSAANDCTGTCSYVFTPQYAQARGVSPGDTVYAQFWSRDPVGASVRRVNASDAIAFTWAP
jgi:hypothetical protein